jgi:hypothetical protein
VNKPTGTQIFTWTLALAVTTHIVWTVIQHNVPTLPILTIALSTLYAMKAGANNLVRLAIEARRQGATR